jgi:hypothetical protein
VEHRIVIERLYSLGNYQNVKVVAETSGIPDEFWNDTDKLSEIREQLQRELLASFAQHMLLTEEYRPKVQEKQFAEIYEENK